MQFVNYSLNQIQIPYVDLVRCNIDSNAQILKYVLTPNQLHLWAEHWWYKFLQKIYPVCMQMKKLLKTKLQVQIFFSFDIVVLQRKSLPGLLIYVIRKVVYESRN